MLGALWQDLRYGIRSLGRTPTFTIFAVLTLALGIGASTTIFGLFEAVLMRKLPVENPEQLYFVAHGSPDGQGIGGNYPYFERVRDAAEGIADVTAYNARNDLKVSTGGPVEITRGQFVSGNYHRVIGVPMLLGRGFTAEDDRDPSAASTAVISEGYWTSLFGRDPQIIGRTITVNGRQVSIVGVTAAPFDGLNPGSRIDLTLPMAFTFLETPEFLTMQDTWGTIVRIVARLSNGVTVERALPTVDAVFQQYVSEPQNSRLRQGDGARNFANAWLVSAESGIDDLRDQYGRALQVLLAMVGVLMVIACVNVANLLLARAGARSKEVALRLAIGAGRRRVIRQCLVESVELSLLAGLVGWLLAGVGVEAITALLATGANPILMDVRPNAVVLAFTIAVSTLTGIAFGLAPALGVTRVDLIHTLKSAATGAARSRVWSSRHTLVAAQVSLCVLLVAGAGLLGRTLRTLDTRESGFDRSNLLMFTLESRGTRFDPAELPSFCDGVIERMSARFGVLAGSCSTSVPVHTGGNARPLVVPGAALTHPPEESLVFMNRISPDYFSTFRIDLVDGRVFNPTDSDGSELVAVISRSAARFFFGDENPVGRRVHFFRDDERLMTVVGVVDDATQGSLRDEPFRTIYTPLTQLAEPETDLTVTVRSSQMPGELVASVRSEVAGANPELIADYIRTMNQQIAGSLVRERVLTILSSAFGLLALALSCIGLYGVIAYDVARKTRDLGIRLVLGGQRGDVLGRVLRQATGIALVGVVVGLVATLASTRVLSTLLFQVRPHDPLTLGFAVVLIVLTTLMASYLPARRASRIDPVMVLRSE